MRGDDTDCVNPGFSSFVGVSLEPDKINPLRGVPSPGSDVETCRLVGRVLDAVEQCLPILIEKLDADQTRVVMPYGDISDSIGFVQDFQVVELLCRGRGDALSVDGVYPPVLGEVAISQIDPLFQVTSRLTRLIEALSR